MSLLKRHARTHPTPNRKPARRRGPGAKRLTTADVFSTDYLTRSRIFIFTHLGKYLIVFRLLRAHTSGDSGSSCRYREEITFSARGSEPARAMPVVDAVRSARPAGR
jgi:hypothetical protein